MKAMTQERHWLRQALRNKESADSSNNERQKTTGSMAGGLFSVTVEVPQSVDSIVDRLIAFL